MPEDLRGHPGWVCTGCGKHVSGSIPVDQCVDCGGEWVEASPNRLACDRCGAADASRVLGSEYNRLCSDCVDLDNREREFGDRLSAAVATMRGEADELAARRPHPDAHLYDIEAGLRFKADELDAFLHAEYYE